MIIVESEPDALSAPIAWSGVNVLVLSPMPSHPQDYGNRKRVFSVCSRLKERGARVTFVHYPSESEWRQRVPVAATAMIQAWDAYYTIPVGRPLHTSAENDDHGIDDWWDESVGVFLRWLFGLSQFDVFIVNYAWLSKAFEFAPPSVIKILDTHDRFSGRRSLLAQLNIAPEFFHTTKAEEIIALDRADVVWAIKEQEQSYFATVTSKPVLTLPHLDPLSVVPVPEPDEDGYLRVGIIGARNNLNLCNLQEFLSLAISEFEKCFAPIMIYIAGSVCDWMPATDARFVRLLGRVDDVEEFYRSVDVICVPLRISTGLKIKTSEALSFGMPVVSLDHGFEGFYACHPYHGLRNFADMAGRLIDIAFDRDLLPDLRTASHRAARLAEQAINQTIEASWAIVARDRRIIVFCVSASVFAVHSPLRPAFLSTLQFLLGLGDVVVAVVAGSIEPLLRADCRLENRAHCMVAVELVTTQGDDVILRRRGYGVTPLGKLIDTFDQTTIVVDALGEELLKLPMRTAKVILRAEMIAQAEPLGELCGEIAKFLKSCSRPVILTAHPSPITAAIANAGGATELTAACCWHTAEAVRSFSGCRSSDQILILGHERLIGLNAFVQFFNNRKLKTILIRAPSVETELPSLNSSMCYQSAAHYVEAVFCGSEALPRLVIDLSFGSLGLQYLRELFVLLNIVIVSGDTEIRQSWAFDGGVAGTAASYEGVMSQVVLALHGRLAQKPKIGSCEEHQIATMWAHATRSGFEIFG